MNSDGLELGDLELLFPSDAFISYAQNGEDVVLARAFEPDQNLGFWIDIGAGDPLVHSVSAAFSQRGWTGINVEPVTREYEKLRAARPYDINLHVAVSATSGLATLYEMPGPNVGLSTLDARIATHHEEDGLIAQPSEVVTMTLADLVSEYVTSRVDFLKIDVEGLEREVIEGADWGSFAPRAVVVEATEPATTTPADLSWEKMLLDAGYSFTLFDGLNRFYAHSDEPDVMRRLSVPANALDNYLPNRWGESLRAAHQRSEQLAATSAGLQGELANARRDLDDLRTVYHHAKQEIDRMCNSKLFRYTAPMRILYARLRGDPRSAEEIRSPYRASY